MEYEFETVLGTLSDSKLRLIDTDGVTVINENDDGGSGLASKIQWSAPSTGMFYVQTLAFDPEQTGSYALTTRSGDTPGSGQIPIDVRVIHDVTLTDPVSNQATSSLDVFFSTTLTEVASGGS